MNCPRCKTPIGPLANPDSIVTCPGCGSRLMTRTAALRSQGGAKRIDGPAPVVPPAFRPLPPPLPSPPQPKPEADAEAKDEPKAEPKTATAGSLSPSDTHPPAPAPVSGRDSEAARSKGREDGEAPREGQEARAEEATLALVLREVRAIAEAQRLLLEELHALRRTGAEPGGQGAPGPQAEAEGPELSPIRVRRQKTVLLVDDDPQTREAAVAELLRASVPVRAYEEGNAALAAIAEEKPDVIALEIGLGGDMGGKDLVNMIKATMEWVDIPILLWTREDVASQKDARLIHGADEVVQKSAGPGALVAHVITAFRRK